MDAVYTKSTSHTAEHIAESIKDIIEKRQSEGVKYAGYITDNTSANKSAWAILEKQFPDMFFYGCVCHVLHLIVKRLCSKVEFLGELEKECKSVVKFFKSSNLERSRLKEMQTGLKLPNLVLPGETRWGSLLKCFTTLLASKAVLEDFVNDEGFISRAADRIGREKREAIRDFINGSAFNNIRIAIKLLTPICNLIVAFQDDKKPISDVCESFLSLNDTFSSINGLTSENLGKIKETVHHYWDFIKNPCHLFSNLLDPRYTGKKLGAERNVVIEQFYDRYPDAGEELDGFFAYCNTNENARVFQGVKSGATRVIVWWEGQCDFPKLREIALQLFSLTPANSACERNFSNFSFVHSKLRNRLGNDKAREAVYVFANAKEFKKSDSGNSNDAVGDYESEGYSSNNEDFEELSNACDE